MADDRTSVTFSKITMSGKPAIRWVVVVVIVIGLGAWWAFRPRSAAVVQPAGANDVGAPSRCYATLTLADGRQLALDDAARGVVATQGGARIVKGADGVIYRADAQGSGELLYNTLDNPRGSTVIDVTLSDGTRVWLNAGSSIRCPVVFPSDDRTVEIRGEAYFEVAGDADRPFRVKKGNVTVNVFGTSFNIRAYSDEPLLRVTLVGGKVRVTADNSLILEPGEQAVVEDRVEVIKDVHLDAVVAWKKGLFSFSHTDLVSAMRELGRWYNVEVVYEGNMPDRYFTGVLDRTLTLDHVLKTLTDGRIHYSIDVGRRRLRVMP
jgi:ferric-dicitrate binding protein FerR (iron transport regulator)